MRVEIALPMHLKGGGGGKKTNGATLCYPGEILHDYITITSFKIAGSLDLSQSDFQSSNLIGRN